MINHKEEPSKEKLPLELTGLQKAHTKKKLELRKATNIYFYNISHQITMGINLIETKI